MKRPDLDAIKSDWAVFHALTGIDRPSAHHRSFLRRERHGSTSVWSNEVGHILWKDHGCGAGGTAIDAAVILWGCTASEAIRGLAEMMGPTSGIAPNTGSALRSLGRRGRSSRVSPAKSAQAPAAPVPNRRRLDDFVAMARRRTLEGDRMVAYYAWRRGLDLSLVAERYNVGFVPEARFPEWGTKVVRNAWALPITGPDRSPVAVKLHLEDPPPGQPKCLWCPFGTKPALRPRHGFTTLWPDPDTEEMDERMGIREYEGGFSRPEAERQTRVESTQLYLCPGELKALAVLSAGRSASSVTAGESHRWTPQLVARVVGRRVVIIYDDDEAGHRFRDSSIDALRAHVAELKTLTFGRGE